MARPIFKLVWKAQIQKPPFGGLSTHCFRQFRIAPVSSLGWPLVGVLPPLRPAQSVSAVGTSAILFTVMHQIAVRTFVTCFIPFFANAKSCFHVGIIGDRFAGTLRVAVRLYRPGRVPLIPDRCKTTCLQIDGPCAASNKRVCNKQVSQVRGRHVCLHGGADGASGACTPAAPLLECREALGVAQHCCTAAVRYSLASIGVAPCTCLYNYP